MRKPCCRRDESDPQPGSSSSSQGRDQRYGLYANQLRDHERGPAILSERSDTTFDSSTSASLALCRLTVTIDEGDEVGRVRTETATGGAVPIGATAAGARRPDAEGAPLEKVSSLRPGDHAASAFLCAG